MDTTTFSNEQLAYAAAKLFGKLWIPRGSRESSLQPFQAFCYELLRSTQIAEPIVLLTLLYVNKFRQRFPDMKGGSGSEYRMFVVALMLASKYLEDNTFTTQTWSEVSHLPAKDLTIMQREFLLALEHRLHVPDHEFFAWKAKVSTILGAGFAAYRNNGISLPTPPASAYVSEACSPAEFLQVVPSPPAAIHRYHEIPAAELLPSPPAKRMRHHSATQYYSSGYGARPHMSRINTAVEPLVIPARSVAMAPALYTPPSSSGVGFSQCDFTFTAPTVPVAAPGSAYYGASSQPHPSVPNTAAAYPCFLSAAGMPSLSANSSYSNVSSALFGAVHNTSEVDKVIGMSMNSAIPHPHSALYQQQQRSVGQFGDVCASAPTGAGHLQYAQQQNPQMATPYSTTAAAAAILASQCPSLYYGGIPIVGFGSGAATFPIYTYGA
ncbi:hypothetical protein IWW39_000962 [Coemansia spiralis]|uniref:Cyclin N-terminal domain-containing protein n=2 Tax=Coemansia TaxID=4863 RepID=A0A9W8L6Y7_9FUNG|nr:hypothetical protein IWW39_000962 [Coemansia spiralis]